MTGGSGTFDLTDRRAIVTGGAGGIGTATANRLAELGADVVVTDIDEAGGVRIAEQVGGSFAMLDVGDPAAWDRVLEATVAITRSMRRFESVELSGEPHWRDRITIRGVDRLTLSVTRPEGLRDRRPATDSDRGHERTERSEAPYPRPFWPTGSTSARTPEPSRA